VSSFQTVVRGTGKQLSDGDPVTSVADRPQWGVASIPDAWLVAPAHLAHEEDEPSFVEVGASCTSRPALAAAAADTADVSLVARALRRDEAALAALYAAHAPAIRRFLADLLGDPAAAADATQETFVRAFRRLDTLRATDRVAPWLFGIARNVSLEHRKARRRRGRVLVPEGSGDGEGVAAEASDGHTPEVDLLGREAARVIEGALGRLSDDRRALLLLRLDHGLAYEEIAALMGFSLAKVKVEIHRARAVLRAELSAYRGERP
jgi:RNA polymerase sigma-70 factor (ECF subfamily)